jgi:DNA-binding transcriptional LysR family regulator
MVTLDVESVRAFVMVADLKSFTRAAESLGTTQGALSVKLQRFEDRLGHRLIERTPRHVRLSSQGEMFVASARDFLDAHERAVAKLSKPGERFKMGIACHVMGPEVPTLLARLRSMEPDLLIEVSLDSSRVLLAAYNAGTLDAIIIRSDEDRRDGTVLCAERIGWYAAAEFDYHEGEPLRLASLSPHCGVREIARQVLEQASIPWTEVFIGGGVAAVVAAISAGLAVGAFPCRLAPPELVEVGPAFGLPSLPTSTVVLHSELSDKKTREALRIIVGAFQSHL